MLPPFVSLRLRFNMDIPMCEIDIPHFPYMHTNTHKVNFLMQSLPVLLTCFTLARLCFSSDGTDAINTNDSARLFNQENSLDASGFHVVTVTLSLYLLLQFRLLQSKAVYFVPYFPNVLQSIEMECCSGHSSKALLENLGIRSPTTGHS